MTTLLMACSLGIAAFLAARLLPAPSRDPGPVDIAALPDVLDALALCAEAGLDVTQGLQRILPYQQSGRFAAEMQRLINQLNAGIGKPEAWREFATRCGQDDVRTFVGALSQAERLGTPPAQVLRNQAQSLRERRFRAAERQAARAPVQLLLPMMMALAAVFIIIFAAVVLTLGKEGL
jgi:tight adherence protein C